MTFFFETYGCQMNVAESSSVEQLLRSRGWDESKIAATADLVIINTCSVRITAETRVFGRLGHFCAQKKIRTLSIIVMGCMAERLHNDLQKQFPKLDYVVGMFERDQFSKIIEEIENKSHPVCEDVVLETPENSYYFAPTSYSQGRFQTFVPIMNGCNNFCTYCIVPYVRGREVSRNLEDILREISFLSEKGVREITLLGQNVNSYEYTDPQSQERLGFPQLLERIANHVKSLGTIKWIRFMSSHPKDLSDELIDVIAKESLLCRYIHLPVQHGSNSILSRMNRRYTRESYIALVEKIRSRIPGVSLSTDILVGFPGETEADVEEILSLVREVRFYAAYMYHYNPREGTAAYEYPDRIDEQIKKNRLDRVITLQHAISAECMNSRIGAVVEVLIESYSRKNKKELFGHTELGDMVVFAEKHPHVTIGSFVTARLESLRGRTFRAKML